MPLIATDIFGRISICSHWCYWCGWIGDQCEHRPGRRIGVRTAAMECEVFTRRCCGSIQPHRGLEIGQRKADGSGLGAEAGWLRRQRVQPHRAPRARHRLQHAAEDLLRLQASDLQRVAREIDMGDLTIALKSSNPALRDAMLNAISKRAAETLLEEMEMLGPVRLKEVEAAQDKIIQVVRKLEEDGEITIDQEGADRVVV